MKKILLSLMAVASLGIANSAHAGGFSFGNVMAGGVVAGTAFYTDAYNQYSPNGRYYGAAVVGQGLGKRSPQTAQ